jgi:hypothetical protein
MSEVDDNQQQKILEDAVNVAETDDSVGSKKRVVEKNRSGITRLGPIKIDLTRREEQFDNGEALAFAASDSRDPAKRYVALIADKGLLPRWKAADTYETLADASLIRLITHGVVYWPASDAQKYAFIYDASVGQSLMSAGGVSGLNWRQTEINDYLITPMTHILKTMMDRGFPHGSIRPDNIFFGGNNKKQPIILGDCLSVFPHGAQPSLFMSVEKASAEPFGRGNGTSADDIYAFGVSLALLLRKNDEIGGVSEYEMVQRKIEHGSYAAIVGAERLPTKYVELLRGLLCDDPSLRWGIEDIFSWLDGSRMTPPALPRRKKANRPFSFRGHKYLFPDSLALDLSFHAKEAQKVIENGDLEQWIEKAFSDKELSENYAKAIERGKVGVLSGQEGAEVTITNVILALNPMLPIFYKDRAFTYDGVGGLMARACFEGADLRPFVDSLQYNILDLAASLKMIPQNEVLALVKSFDLCRTILRQKKRGNSTVKCVYHLCRTAPCFSPQFKKYFVYDATSFLLSFEEISSKGGQIALFMDQHCIAFFSIREKKFTERVMYDLGQSEKDAQIAGNLRFFAMMQKKTKVKELLSIAKVFVGSLDGVYQVYNNIKLREQIIQNVKKEADKGNLVGMSALIDNHAVRQRDANAFELAKREYKMLQYEYDQYNRKLASKSTYGVVNGQETASLVSWGIATLITIMSVFAYISGYRFF